MGAYINPTDMTKERWLYENAESLNYVPAFDEQEGKLPVCLMQNTGFTAAAIAFSASEVEAFNALNDHRPKNWFFAKIEDLHKVSPELKRYME